MYASFTVIYTDKKFPSAVKKKRNANHAQKNAKRRVHGKDAADWLIQTE